LALIEHPDKEHLNWQIREGIELSHLIGFKNNDGGKGLKIGFIFSNYRYDMPMRDRDLEKDKLEDFMMPAACLKARSVDIHNNGQDIVYGFKFYDANKSCIF